MYGTNETEIAIANLLIKGEEKTIEVRYIRRTCKVELAIDQESQQKVVSINDTYFVWLNKVPDEINIIELITSIIYNGVAEN